VERFIKTILKLYLNPVLQLKARLGIRLIFNKEIVEEEYHKGEIKVLSSDIGKGTTMQVSLKK
jgi:hypothetical protein